MNAYALADEVLNINCLVTRQTVANALRQQADQLKKYELRNIAQCDRIAILEAQNKLPADRIAELEDKLSMYEIKDLDRGIIGRTKDYAIHDLVHRTTPQTKPLSDEEIISEWISSDRNYYNFARTIEERILGQ